MITYASNEKDLKSDLKDMDKSKFLAPHDLILGQFLYVIRKRIDLDASAALYIFVNDNVLVNTSANHKITIYESHKDEDGFFCILHIVVKMSLVN